MKHLTSAILFMIYTSFPESLSSSIPSTIVNGVTGIITNSNGQNISEKVQFFLYTPNNVDNGQQIWLNNDTSIKQSNFDPALLTKFIIHGWRNNHTSSVGVIVKNAFLEQDSYNIIVVDWGAIAKQIYPAAVAQLRTVANYIGKMIVYLENGFLEIKNLTIVGHSLGAHVTGLAARYVKKTANTKVLHIVGLDPANPGFEILARSLRIRTKDAELVEIIHSNTGLNGVFEPVGHLDFYPNGFNSRQPGCGIDLVGSCAHSRSYKYYAEALTRPSEWIGLKCGSFIKFLGNLCRGNTLAPFPLWTANFSRPHGTYVLVTNSKEPFGLGIKGTKPSTYFEFLTD